MRSLPLSQFFIGIFSLLIFITSIRLYGGVSEYGAGFMPTILSALLLFFTVLDGIIHYVQRPAKLGFTGAEWRSLILIIVVVSLFCLLITSLGFMLCAFLLLFALMSLRNPKKYLVNVLSSAIAAGLIYYVFGKVLMVALPTGFWS